MIIVIDKIIQSTPSYLDKLLSAPKSLLKETVEEKLGMVA